MADAKKIKIGGTWYNVKDETARNGLSAKQDKLTFDSAPTASSTNPVTSGGVKTALDGKVSKSGDTMTGNLTMEKSSDPSIYFKQSDDSMGNMYLRDNQLFFSEYPADQQSYREVYRLPAPNSGMTATKWYDILTSKNPVTVAQGGTGGTNSGVKTLSGSAFTGTLSYQTIGKFGLVSGQIKLASNLTANYIDLQTIPAGFRPSTVISGVCGGQDGWGLIYIYTSGVIRFYKAQNTSWSANWNIYFSFSYFVG